MVSRRQFIKTGTAAAAGAAFNSGNLLAQGSKPAVAVAKGKPTEIVKKAVDALGGIKKFVKEGDRVVIKANMGFPNPPEWSTTTHPDVVKSIAQLCLDAGAQRVILIDNPLRDAQMCKEKSGIGAAIKDMKGVVLAMLKEEKFYQPTDVPKAKQLKNVAIAKEVLRANCLINLPTAKTHSATGVSLGIKNLMGLVWDRSAYHNKMELNMAIAEQLYVMKPNLTIIDCVYALLTNGPAGPGKTEELNTVVASTDPVAADSYTVGLARWYNRDWKGTQVKYIKNAYELGFGEIDVEKMDVKEV